jgi:hypothetical protein
MKKITLLVASIFLVGNMANASENPFFSDNTTIARFSFEEPIAFTERGIEFFVFPNGEFDFNTRPNDSDGAYHFKSAGRRVTIEINRRPTNYGVRIEHDAFGRVRRVGNTFINYDYNDRVSRIGSVFMRYNRFALSQVGGLQIIYNRRGQIVDMFGSVKGRNYGNYSNHGHNEPHDYNDYDNNPSGDYYYKTNDKKEKMENRSEEKREDKE